MTGSTDRPVGASFPVQSIAYRLSRYIWRQTGKRVLSGTRTTVRVTRNIVMRWGGWADYRRWSSSQGLEEWWVERTKTIAKLVPAGSKVIEFGAGRRQLEKFLSADCSYTPSDLVDRGPGTIICDLNRRPLPDLSHIAAEVAIFGGVLEYVQDVAGLFEWLGRLGVHTCIASFDPVPAGLGVIGRYRESSRRSYYGYMNRLTETELLRIFQATGFTCSHRQNWTTQILFQLRKVAQCTSSSHLAFTAPVTSAMRLRSTDSRNCSR